MIILDTSALYALMRAEDPMSGPVFEAIRRENLRVVSPFVIAELDYLFLTRYGVPEEIRVMDELASGNFDLACIGAADIVGCISVMSRYRDHQVGVTDASIVILANRYGTNRIATLDRRHFGVLRGIDGQPFELLP